MTPNKRIALNIAATYGRSLLALMCGLFSGRWILMALGEVDYGLSGLVGGLTAFVVFFNDLLAGAVSRYYAVSVGHAEKFTNSGLEECRGWFCTALFVHMTLPIVLIIIGYPCGVWAVKSFLTIPIDRIDACIWVWRCTCISCFIGMLNVPFRAMYIAKQYIAELTIYSLVTTMLNFSMAYYMVSHPGVWLTRYAIWGCFLSIIPNIIICIRAIVIFPECRIRGSRLFDVVRLKALWRYVLFRFVGAVSDLFQSQGNSILVNKFLGARFNATMAVGGTMASHVVSLSTAMSGAIGPAIFNAYGSGDKNRMAKLVMCASKVGTVLYLIFMVPAALEVDELFTLWLKNPPSYASFIGVCILFAYLTERITDGEVNAIYATGNIKRFQLVLSMCCWLGLLACGTFLLGGCGIIGVGMAIVIFKTLIMIARVIYARLEARLSARRWVVKVFLPLLVVIAICFAIGYLPRLFMEACFLRVIVTTVIAEIVLLPLVWFVVLGGAERTYFISRIKTYSKFIGIGK